MASKPGRNDPCSCGSGAKYKHCCGGAAQQSDATKHSTIDLGSLWNEAIAQYGRGERASARASCERILFANARHADALHLLGIVAYDDGRVADAVRAVQSALSIVDSAAYHNTLCMILTKVREFDAAIEHGQRALALQPNYALAYFNVGQAEQHCGRTAAAIESYRRATQLDPRYALAHSSLGDVLLESGSIDEAIAAYRKAIDCEPRFAQAHNNLGNAWRTHGDTERAAGSYKRAIECNPRLAQAHRNLGALLASQGKHRDAIHCYYRAVEIDPGFIEAHCDLAACLDELGDRHAARARLQLAAVLRPQSGLAQRKLGQWYQLHAAESGEQAWRIARQCYERAIAVDATDAAAHVLLGGLERRANRLSLAAEHYRHAIKLTPTLADAHNNLGTVLQELGEWEAAVACYREALRLNPDSPEAFNNLGNANKQRGALAEAAQCFERALALRPIFPEALSNLGLVRELQGDVAGALVNYRRALEIDPHSAAAYSVWLFAKAYSHDDDEHLAAVASGYESACLALPDRIAANARRLPCAPLSGRRLRVGYLSGDFREHPVAFFIAPILANHDRSKLEVFAYATHPTEDAVTERIRGCVEHWCAAYELTDTQLRDRIEADDIDVLIDLCGHTAHNRLGVLARRAAPVQAHYLGYFATTGIRNMDYWIGDDMLSPPQVQRHFTETLWNLPRVSVAYEGRDDMPETAWRPDDSGAVRFGTFNKLIKINDATLRVWSEILRALPKATLLLKTKELSDAGNRERVRRQLCAAGIEPERVELDAGQTTRAWRDHMRSYDRLDIALDPIGSWGGNTTTCDALWMGVPVITLLGETAPERMTAPMLAALGHPEWIAKSREEYVGKAVALANDAQQRIEWRRNQRERMRRSALCDAMGLTRCLEDAYREMYLQVLDRELQPPQTVAQSA